MVRHLGPRPEMASLAAEELYRESERPGWRARSRGIAGDSPDASAGPSQHPGDGPLGSASRAGCLERFGDPRGDQARQKIARRLPRADQIRASAASSAESPEWHVFHRALLGDSLPRIFQAAGDCLPSPAALLPPQSDWLIRAERILDDWRLLLDPRLQATAPPANLMEVPEVLWENNSASNRQRRRCKNGSPRRNSGQTGPRSLPGSQSCCDGRYGAVVP